MEPNCSLGWIAVGLFFIACSSHEPKEDGTGSALSALPASAAGTSTESGPGVPADFAGQIRDSIPLTDEERAANAAGDALAAARNPPGVSPLDLGFGSVPTPHKAPAKTKLTRTDGAHR